MVVLWGYRVMRGFLLVMSVPFEHFDLVAVRVLNEEVTREQGAVVVLEFAHVVRRHAELQETLGAIAKKIGPVVIKYVQDNGYTMLLDNTGQPSQGGLSVLWTQPGTTDISQAVVDAYNASSGVAAPAVPSAPSATRPRPATTTPKPTTPQKQ